MLSPIGPPAFTKTTSSILASLFVTRLTVVSVNVFLVTVSVVVPNLVGAGGSLAINSLTLESEFCVDAAIGWVIEDESVLGEVDKRPDIPGSLPKLDVLVLLIFEVGVDELSADGLVLLREYCPGSRLRIYEGLLAM